MMLFLRDMVLMTGLVVIAYISIMIGGGILDVVVQATSLLLR
jgi:hypothetical protein